MKYIICLLMALMLPFAALAADNRYEDIGFYGEYDMCPVKRNGLWGFVDHTGQLTIPCEWDGVGMVFQGRASVYKDDRWGAIDKAGNILVPCEWDYLVPESDGGYTVKRNGYSGALAADGTVLIPCDRYTYVGPVINGARHIGLNDLWGLCTETGEIITPCQWRSTGYFHEGLAWVCGEGFSYGYINEQGETVIPTGYGYAHLEDFVGGSAAVRFTNGSWQLMDTRGRFLCEKPWDDMEQFAQGDLIPVKKNGKYGFINRQGETVIPLVYDNAQHFYDGLAGVVLDGDAFWIDETGAKAVDRPEGYSSWQFNNGFVCMKDENSLYGVMDKSGAFIIPCEWPDGLINPFDRGGITYMWTDTHYAFFNKQGQMVTGQMHERGRFKFAIQKEYLFLVEDGVLSIWHADGRKVY